MMTAILQILDVVKEAKPPEPNPELITAALDLEDDSGMLVQELNMSAVLTPAEDITAIIDYEDARGQETCRRIRVKSITERNGSSYLNAYCFERKAPRMFAIESIAAIYSPQTGELLDTDPHVYFEGLPRKPSKQRKSKPTGMSAFPKAYSRCYAGIKVLVYIARCDGQFHHMEVNAIMSYVRRTCNAGHRNLKYDKGVFSEYIQKQCPDYDSFERSLKTIYAQGGSGFAAFYDGIRDVIDADGRLAEEEVTIHIELTRLLKKLEIEKWDKYHDEPYPY